MRSPDESLPADFTVREALDRVRSSRFQSWLVTEGSRVLGVVTLTGLQQRLAENGARPLSDFVNGINFPHLHTDQSLDLALERMGTNHVQVLPVVSRADIHKLLGIVTLNDVLDSYGLGVPDPT